MKNENPGVRDDGGKRCTPCCPLPYIGKSGLGGGYVLGFAQVVGGGVHFCAAAAKKGKTRHNPWDFKFGRLSTTI